jgi:hypothetical protein
MYSFVNSRLIVLMFLSVTRVQDLLVNSDWQSVRIVVRRANTVS